MESQDIQIGNIGKGPRTSSQSHCQVLNVTLGNSTLCPGPLVYRCPSAIDALGVMCHLNRAVMTKKRLWWCLRWALPGSNLWCSFEFASGWKHKAQFLRDSLIIRVFYSCEESRCIVLRFVKVDACLLHKYINTNLFNVICTYDMGNGGPVLKWETADGSITEHRQGGQGPVMG